MTNASLYSRLAAHYLGAIHHGSLAVGTRMPSLRTLMQTHQVSLSTALQVCRHLEQQGWLEARPRSGYFVRHPPRHNLAPISEPAPNQLPDIADYAGIHAKVSSIVARGQQYPVHTNLAIAVAAPELYPGRALARSAARVLRTQAEVLTAQSSFRGHQPFRSAIARRALQQGISAHADEVIVTHGCSEALNLALRATTQAGDMVAVESPSFYGVLQSLESHGLRALEIPTSPQSGISLDALELALATQAELRAVVLQPNLHNPLGCSMPQAHKARLLALCEAKGVAVIEDDTYSAFAEPSDALRALKAGDRSGNVIHCSSLNKTLAPGLRLGWMLAGRWQARVEMLKYAQTRYHDELSLILATEFLSSTAYERHLRRLREQLRQQRERAAEIIATCFPAGTRMNVPRAGVVLWVELPGGISSEALFDAALQEGIRIAPGALFSNAGRFDHFIRLSCGLPDSTQVERALQRLAELAKRMLGC